MKRVEREKRVRENAQVQDRHDAIQSAGGQPQPDRRRFLTTGGALALGGAAAYSMPAIVRADARGGISPGTDFRVNAEMIVDAMADLIQDLIGPAQALKDALIGSLGVASSALGTGDGTTAITNLEQFESDVGTNLTELNASNGGLTVDGLGDGDTEGGLGDGLRRLASFLVDLGEAIVDWFRDVVWALIKCLFACARDFAGCLAAAEAEYEACMAGAYLGFAALFPLVGAPLAAALLAAATMVCHGDHAADVASCKTAFVACVVACF